MRHPLPIRSYRKISPESCINCFVESKPADTKGAYALVRAPGISYLTDLGATGRGLAIFDGKLWAVAGDGLINLSTISGGVIETSTPIIGEDRVSMAATVDRLCVVAAGSAWLATPDNVVTQITDPDFRTAGVVDFVDQYLVFSERGSPRWFSSDLNAPASYDSTYFATAEFQPDDLLGLIADHGQVLLAGERSMELWANDGSTGFPFSRISNGVIELGCAAAHSLAKLDNSIFWLASDLTVRRLSGFTPVRVSTHGIEWIISQWGNVADCYGMAYSFGGHLCYVLTCPGKGTVVFDASTGEWHERRSINAAYWQVVALAQYAEQVYALHEDGRIGIMDTNTYTEFGDTQRVEFTCAPIYAAARRVTVGSLELQVKSQ